MFASMVYKTFNTERVMRWRLLIEEYGPELRYIKGKDNIVADVLSRYDMKEHCEACEECVDCCGCGNDM